jgi:phosphopantetheine--protein transferase-like protein
MSQTEQLRAMIATMLMVAPEQVGAETSLASLNTSLGSAKVRLGLKRLGLALPAGVAPVNFGALVAAISGETGPVAGPVAAAYAPSATAPGSGDAGLGGLQVGLDVEEIASLPVAADYWEHEFYRGTFARSEIAYAVQQPEPRTHFAGFWCAREALRKCDQSFAGVSANLTAVAHDVSGRPYLTITTDAGPARLAHALSISHTGTVATAVVVLQAAVIAPPPAVVAAPAASKPVELPVAEVRKSRGLAKLFGV